MSSPSTYPSGSALPRYLGLTGGIASGKSTVAKILQTLGGYLIDADAISKSLTQPAAHPTLQTEQNAKPYTGSALQHIFEAFGQRVFESPISANLTLNRAALRALMLQDAAAKRTLEGILHPLIQEAMACERKIFERKNFQRIAFERNNFVRNDSERNPQKTLSTSDPVAWFCVYDVPLLVEGLGRTPPAPWRGLVDELWVVDSSAETQVQRVLARNAAAPGAWTVQEVERVIATQASRAQRVAVADVVIYNDNITLENLQSSVRTALGGTTQQ